MDFSWTAASEHASHSLGSAQPCVGLQEESRVPQIHTERKVGIKPVMLFWVKAFSDLQTYLYSSSTMLAGSACSMASAKNSSSDGMNSLNERYGKKNVICIHQMKQHIHCVVFWLTDLLSDLQASMLSWFRFHSRVNSSLTKHTQQLRLWK